MSQAQIKIFMAIPHLMLATTQSSSETEMKQKSKPSKPLQELQQLQWEELNITEVEIEGEPSLSNMMEEAQI